MTARDALQQVRERGIRLETKAGKIIYRARRGAMTHELRAVIISHRDEIIELLRPATTGLDPGALGHLLSMPLDVFARDGQLLEVRVPGVEVTLWFVPREADAEHLVREGVSRGRVWTALELMELLSRGNLQPEHLTAVALAKVEFGGDVLEALPLVDAPLGRLSALAYADGHFTAQVFRRAKVFKQQITAWTASGRFGVPVLTVPESPEPRSGQCVSCGCLIADGRRCAVCVEAVHVALALATKA